MKDAAERYQYLGNQMMTVLIRFYRCSLVFVRLLSLSDSRKHADIIQSCLSDSHVNIHTVVKIISFQTNNFGLASIITNVSVARFQFDLQITSF